MSKELEALRNLTQMAYNYAGFDEKLTKNVRGYFEIIEIALKRIPELEKEIEDTHIAYTMAIEKHIKDENEYIQWVQEGGYDKTRVQALEIIVEKRVNIGSFIKCCSNISYEEYKKQWGNWKKDILYNLSKEPLTQEEFDLLKKVL